MSKFAQISIAFGMRVPERSANQWLLFGLKGLLHLMPPLSNIDVIYSRYLLDPVKAFKDIASLKTKNHGSAVRTRRW